MTDKNPEQAAARGKPTAKRAQQRAERQAEALRANLHRRKAQRTERDEREANIKASTKPEGGSGEPPSR